MLVALAQGRHWIYQTQGYNCYIYNPWIGQCGGSDLTPTERLACHKLGMAQEEVVDSPYVA